MDYAGTLTFLQNLLSNNQATNASQFNQDMGEKGREYDLGNAQQTATLGETGREFDASTALQKVIADWQNTLATNQQAQAAQAQQFGQNMTTRQYNDSRAGMTVGQLSNLWAQANAGKEPTRDGIPLSKWSAQQNPMSSSYAYGIPSGNGFNYNPYTGKNIYNS